MKKLYTFDKELLAYKRVNMTKIILICLFSLASIITLCSFICRGETKYIHGEKNINLTTDSTFQKQKIIDLIRELPFKHKDIVFAQVLLESDHFRSPLFKEKFNCLGTKKPGKRLSMAIGTDENGYSIFKDAESAVVDRLIYEQAYMKDLTREQYLSYLNKVYATSGDYDKALENIIKKNKLKELFK